MPHCSSRVSGGIAMHADFQAVWVLQPSADRHRQWILPLLVRTQKRAADGRIYTCRCTTLNCSRSTRPSSLCLGDGGACQAHRRRSDTPQQIPRRHRLGPSGGGSGTELMVTLCTVYALAGLQAICEGDVANVAIVRAGIGGGAILRCNLTFPAIGATTFYRCH